MGLFLDPADSLIRAGHLTHTTELTAVHLLQATVCTALGLIKSRYYITAWPRMHAFLKYPVGAHHGAKIAAFAAAFINDELH